MFEFGEFLNSTCFYLYDIIWVILDDDLFQRHQHSFGVQDFDLSLVVAVVLLYTELNEL